MAGRTGIKSKIRSQQLNPVFHFQNKKEDEDVLTNELIKQSRLSGVLNLSGRGLGTGNLNNISITNPNRKKSHQDHQVRLYHLIS